MMVKEIVSRRINIAPNPINPPGLKNRLNKIITNGKTFNLIS